MSVKDAELTACVPVPVKHDGFNKNYLLPYGLTIRHVLLAMEDFIDFLGFVNRQLYSQSLPRLESFLMPANFSSIVGEFMVMRIPDYCHTLVKNRYHNGHPDLVPKGRFPGDAVQYAREGIEVKGSRRASGWQGHNPESIWLMVFHFDSNTSSDKGKGIDPKPFRFKAVYVAKLDKDDWNFSGRSATSRRTITASVNRWGVEKMKSNWLYKDF